MWRSLKAILGILVIVAAIFIIQVYLIDSFGSNLPESASSRNSEVGSCLLFICEKIIYPTWVNVTEPSMDIGFKVGPDDLKFGEIPVGGGGKRFIIIANDGKAGAKIRLVSYGNISSYIRFSRNDFILNSEENVEVEVNIKTETGMKIGEYSGDIMLIRLSPKNELMDFLLGWV